METVAHYLGWVGGGAGMMGIGNRNNCYPLINNANCIQWQVPNREAAANGRFLIGKPPPMAIS